MEFSLSPGERQRLASLLAAVATPLLLLVAFTLVGPLLPPRLLDPLWQLALCNGLSSSGPLALVAVLLVHLGAALDPDAGWLQRRRIRLAGACRWISVAFLLLIPLQGWAAWQSLERIAVFRKAVTGATSVAALQANLATIQAPPLSREDQSQGLRALKASLLSQLQIAEQQARRAASDGGGAGSGRGPSRLMAVLIDSLRVVLLALSLAMGFAAAGQRHGPGWGQAADSDYFEALAGENENPPRG